MATHHGKNGVVKVGVNVLAEVTEFSVEEKDGFYNLSGVFKRMESLS